MNVAFHLSRVPDMVSAARMAAALHCNCITIDERGQPPCTRAAMLRHCIPASGGGTVWLISHWWRFRDSRAKRTSVKICWVGVACGQGPAAVPEARARPFPERQVAPCIRRTSREHLPNHPPLPTSPSAKASSGPPREPQRQRQSEYGPRNESSGVML